MSERILRDEFIPSNIDEIRKIMEEMSASAKEEYSKNNNIIQNKVQSQGNLDLKESNSGDITGVGGIPGTDNNSKDTTYIIEENRNM